MGRVARRRARARRWRCRCDGAGASQARGRCLRAAAARARAAPRRRSLCRRDVVRRQCCGRCGATACSTTTTMRRRRCCDAIVSRSLVPSGSFRLMLLLLLLLWRWLAVAMKCRSCDVVRRQRSRCARATHRARRASSAARPPDAHAPICSPFSVPIASPSTRKQQLDRRSKDRDSVAGLRRRAVFRA